MQSITILKLHKQTTQVIKVDEFTVVIILFSIASLVILTWIERLDNLDVDDITVDKDEKMQQVEKFLND